MKKLKKLSLDHLSEVVLNERKMGQILGGDGGYICQCGCHYEGMGGSSTADNDSANDAGNHHSDDCTQPQIFCTESCEIPAQPEGCSVVIDQICGSQNLFC